MSKYKEITTDGAMILRSPVQLRAKHFVAIVQPSNCHSRARGNPGLFPRLVWIPAFAGMTEATAVWSLETCTERETVHKSSTRN